MTETRPARRTDRSTVALVALLAIACLVLASPFGWLYVFPAIGDTAVFTWTFLTGAWTEILDGALTAVDGMTGILGR